MNTAAPAPRELYTSIGFGPSAFRPGLFQFRLQMWNFPDYDQSVNSLLALNEKLVDYFPDADPVPERWEDVITGEGLRIHLLPHQEKTENRYPGFTVIAEGYDTLAEAEFEKARFMDFFSELTGAGWGLVN